MNKNNIAALILVVGVLAAGIWYVKFGPKKQTDIGFEGAKTKVTDFVEKNLVQPGTKIEVKNASLEGGLYKVSFTVAKQDVDTYITKDGTKFFPEAIDIADFEKKANEMKNQVEEESAPVSKTDIPEVNLYVMSFCPFGNKAEDTMKPVYNLLKEKVTFNFHYIVSTNGDTVQSLHGEKEVTQNEREACVLKQYGKGKWMDFVTYINTNCGSDGSCWEAGAKSLAIDTTKVNACVNSEGFSLMKADEEVSKTAGASGSPTMLINGTKTKLVYQYGNSEAYKQAICDSFNTAPAECSKTLSAETSTTQGGSCGS